MDSQAAPVRPQKQLWNTASCLNIASLLNHFENKHYPIELRCKIDDLSHWLHSDCFFYSALLRVTATGELEPVSVASFLLVSKTSYVEFARGKLREADLKPWRRDICPLEPVVYYSSLILAERADGPLLFQSLSRDFAQYLEKIEKIYPSMVFALASNFSGYEHLNHHGFKKTGKTYLFKFPILQLKNPTNRKDIWWTILHC